MTDSQNPSFIEAARRRQIVDTAIRLIARKGIAQASLAEIAREAGCSKGVIHYHFKGKDELFDTILARVIREPADFIKAKVDACERALDRIRAYIAANFEFMKAHRDNYIALVDLWGSRGGHADGNIFKAEAYAPSRTYLSRILDAGQRSGEIAPLPSATVASVIPGAIDGTMHQWVYDPESVDLDAGRDQIIDMVSAHLQGARGSLQTSSGM